MSLSQVLSMQGCSWVGSTSHCQRAISWCWSHSSIFTSGPRHSDNTGEVPQAIKQSLEHYVTTDLCCMFIDQYMHLCSCMYSSWYMHDHWCRRVPCSIDWVGFVCVIVAHVTWSSKYTVVATCPHFQKWHTEIVLVKSDLCAMSLHRERLSCSYYIQRCLLQCTHKPGSMLPSCRTLPYHKLPPCLSSWLSWSACVVVICCRLYHQPVG